MSKIQQGGAIKHFIVKPFAASVGTIAIVMERRKQF